MHIVSFREPLYAHFSKTSGALVVHFEPHKPYVVSNSQFNQLMQHPPNKAVLLRNSSLESRLPAFNAKVTPEGPLLFWTGAGGFGDQIMAWPVARALHHLGFKVHALVDPGNLPCWWGFPWVNSLVQFPTYLEALMLFKHHALFEVVTNADEHADQLHPVDSMLLRLGLDPAQIDPELKVVRPAFTPGELARAQAEKAGRQIGIYQLAAAGAARALSPEASVGHLAALAKAFPSLTWFAAHDACVSTRYRLAVEAANLSNVVPANYQNLRDLWAMTSQAAVVVAPDSLLVHLAGSMSIPCVGLWGATDPQSRVKYYKNHIALWKSERCAAAPCFYHYDAFPEFCPTRQDNVCNVLKSVHSDELVSAVKSVLG